MNLLIYIFLIIAVRKVTTDVAVLTQSSSALRSGLSRTRAVAASQGKYIDDRAFSTPTHSGPFY